jgi:hypothetical protein
MLIPQLKPYYTFSIIWLNPLPFVVLKYGDDILSFSAWCTKELQSEFSNLCKNVNIAVLCDIKSGILPNSDKTVSNIGTSKKVLRKKLYDILAQNKGHFHKYWQIMHIFYL